MTVQLNKAASFFGKQDVTIEVLSFLDPRSMARAFAACKDFQGVKHEVFSVFLRTCTGLVSLNDTEKLSALSLKKVADWGSLCNRMEGRFAVEIGLCRAELSIAKRQFQSVLASSSMARLTRLAVQDRVTLLDNHIIGNPQLLALTKAAPHLHHLELAQSGVTAEGLGCLRHLELESLSLTGCHKITDHVASALAGMTSLTELGLSGCERVTGRGLGMLLQTLKNLRKVDISDSGLLSAKARNHELVQALTEHGKQLTHVTIDHLSCDFAKVEAMVKSCTNLVFLSRAIVIGFTSKDARRFQAINPNLHVRILKRKLQLDSPLQGIIFEDDGRPRVKLLNPRRRADERFKIVKPPQASAAHSCQKATPREEFLILLVGYLEMFSPVLNLKFEHVHGSWTERYSGIDPYRELFFRSTDKDSEIRKFWLSGYKDGSVRLGMEFNPEMDKSTFAWLRCSNLPSFPIFTTKTDDELQRLHQALVSASEIPKPYLSHIDLIVKDRVQRNKTESSKE